MNWTKRALTMGLALAALAVAGPASAARTATTVAAYAAITATAYAPQQNEAEATYREARQALSRSEFQRAVDRFMALRERYPESEYAADSYYWQAFSLYRMNGLREALGLLETTLASHPRARTAGDARDLELRIRSQLAQRGDAVSAELALRAAQAALAGSKYGTDAELARAEMMSRVMMRQAESALAAVTAGGALGPSPTQEGCEEEQVQQAALQAVMQMASDRALPILRKVLERRDECSVPLRKQAIFVLSQHDPSEAEMLMIEVARGDPDPEVQEAAVFWLSQVGSEAAFDALSGILATSDDPRLQENAIFALSQQSSPGAGELLRSYAADTSKPEHVREKAIFWLVQHPDEDDADLLIDLYARLDSERLKESVFMSLAQLGEQAAVEWMLERALDEAEPIELRKQALFWAGQHSGIDLDRLTGLYGQLSDREMKEQLIFLYAQRSESAAVERLIDIAREETDVEIRKRVIFWLGQSGDDRAIEFLLELVGEPF